MGFSFVIIFIGFIATFIGYLWKENQKLKNSGSEKLEQKLDVIEKLVTAERLDHAVLTNRIMKLEQEVEQIKEVLKSEAELKLLIKENK